MATEAMTTSATLATLPSVPTALTALGIGLQEQTGASSAFLLQLYMQTRWSELAGTYWPDEQKAAFLRQQFTFQDIHYARYYPTAARGIITRSSQPIGRLLLYALPGELRIVDIALLPSQRSQGIGTALISAVSEQALARGETVTIHVEAFNRARELYSRLGFIDVGGDQVYRKMECRPGNMTGTLGQLKTA